VTLRLVHVDDSVPGIQRRRRGTGFSYHDPDGRVVREAEELARIRRLAIPPAYTKVWICPRPDGHLQATGRDARGRKQYRYHAEWQRARGVDKFARLREFGLVLPRVRTQVAADLAFDPAGFPPRNAVLATLVRLLDTTLVRIGNEEYARDNGSFGLTTLRSRHASVSGARLRLRFRGKSGVPHEVDLHDPQAARVIARCQALPGQELFRYEDEQGAPRSVDSGDVNDYLREASQAEITAKDFRTWHASVLALALLRQQPDARPTQILQQVAKQLRNTVAVCRKSYVHPRVLAAADTQPRVVLPRGRRRGSLSADESALLRLLADA